MQTERLNRLNNSKFSAVLERAPSSISVISIVEILVVISSR
jgi:hypothetical protein